MKGGTFFEKYSACFLRILVSYLKNHLNRYEFWEKETVRDKFPLLGDFCPCSYFEFFIFPFLGADCSPAFLR